MLVETARDLFGVALNIFYPLSFKHSFFACVKLSDFETKLYFQVCIPDEV